MKNSQSPIQTQSDIDQLEQISIGAGKILLSFYLDTEKQAQTIKHDQSVVTEADLSANKAIIEQLSQHFPTIPIVSEENSIEENLNACSTGHYFMIDPLDGTSSFIKHSDEFTVNIAYIDNFKSSFGMIYLPVQQILYFTGLDKKSYIKNIPNNTCSLIQASHATNDLRIIATKREPEKSTIISELNLHQLDIKRILSISSSYKFCLMADGSADLYPRRANISAWDIAAGHALVEGANGHLLSTDGTPFEYKFNTHFKVPFFNVFGQKKYYSDLEYL